MLIFCKKLRLVKKKINAQPLRIMGERNEMQYCLVKTKNKGDKCLAIYGAKTSIRGKIGEMFDFCLQFTLFELVSF